jgi:hypothetical protein
MYIHECNGLAWDTWGKQSQWLPLTEITNLKKKKSQLCMYVKFVEHSKSDFVI